MYQCMWCNSECDTQLEFCPSCFREDCYIPVVKKFGSLGRVNDAEVMSAKELMKDGINRHHAPWPWKQLFPEGFGMPMFMILWGPPGSGKSSLALLLAHAWKTKTMYLSFEEGYSFTLKEKIARLEVTDCYFSIPNSIESMNEKTAGCGLVIVDSLQLCGLDADTLKNMFVDANKSLIIISQIRTDGLVKGGMAGSHAANCSVYVEKYGCFRFVKNRYGVLSEGYWAEQNEDTEVEFHTSETTPMTREH